MTILKPDLRATVPGVVPALLTDLYQLTMAQGYWLHQRANRKAIFHLFFRKHPFGGGYTISAGLQTAIDLLRQFKFDRDSIDYLSGLAGHDGQPLFQPAFLEFLQTLKLTVDLYAVPEGTVVFPHQPLVRVEGPMLQCQILETLLLNVINFQTLIATKSARICRAAEGDTVMEFGMRRAQGVDGALAASRAAYVGGCHATSNVLAGQRFGIPVKGTHAHSWVMSFDDEFESFEAYAQAMPNNCVFLVDTFDTLEGVRKAIQVGTQLRSRGHEMLGIRLDSGDLAYLSVRARALLDEAGFENVQIVASNDLDERLITSLKSQGAKISIWGVGTRLATAYDQPALGGVYKLAAVEDEEGNWQPKIKLSEQLIKTSTPGKLQVRRYYRKLEGKAQALADLIYNEHRSLPDSPVLMDPWDATRRRKMDADQFEDLLVPVFQSGELVYQAPTLEAIRSRTQQQLDLFNSSHLRLDNPHEYPVGLDQALYQQKSDLVMQLRGVNDE